MNTKVKIINNALMLAAGLMFVAGCGYNNARDDAPAAEAAKRATGSADAKYSLEIGGTSRRLGISLRTGAEWTIDPAIQRIVSEALARHADTNDTGRGFAAVVSVGDGAVLAMADCGVGDESERPFALMRTFEPGHLLSPLMVAAAFDADIAKPDTELFTNALEGFYQQFKLPSDAGYVFESSLSVSNGLIYSSNIILSKLGILVGPATVHSVFDRFGICHMTAAGMLPEHPGRLRPPEKWAKNEWARIPIGQGVTVNLMQIVRAYAILANHGRSVDLRYVKGASAASSESAEQIVSRKAADGVCSILEGAVSAADLKGVDVSEEEMRNDLARCLVKPMPTGRRAAVAGVRVAGKTSTSLRRKEDSWKYETDRYVASFAGFFPADNPSFVVAVCFETRRQEGLPYLHFGGGRPAMAFAEIVKEMSFGHNRAQTKGK